MLALLERGYGVEDHEIDPKTGRPKAPQSWMSARIELWTGSLFLVGSFFLPFLYYRHWGADRWLAIMIATIPLLALKSWLLMRSLKRKEAAMRTATSLYDAGLTTAFTELAADLDQAEQGCSRTI